MEDMHCLFWLLIASSYNMHKIGDLEEKAAAKVRGQIWDGPIAQNDPYIMFLLCTKFHAFIIKWTIFQPIRSTSRNFYDHSKGLSRWLLYILLAEKFVP